MKTLNLIQGTPEWNAHRATAFNASDAPAMLGLSKYKSRNDLIKERATGIIPEVDDATQRRFNDGHRFEALARPLAETIIGEELSPITGAEGKYSASFDGITFDQSVIFEHKSMNANLREALFSGAELDEQYRAQMEHQLLVSGADKCLFMASTFDPNDELVEEMHCWYEPDGFLRKRIVDGWAQFELDVEEYKRKLAAGEIEHPKEAPKAEAIIALPSVFVQATGMVTASNLTEFKEAASTFIANIKTELVTDEDFAQAEATVKFCKDAETNLESTKASVLAQMSTVDEVVRTLDHIKKQLADKRLMLDKLVKSEKEARKLAIVNDAAAKFTAHVEMLEAEIKPIRLSGVQVKNSLADAIKGKKSLSSMQDAVDTALANIKIALDAEAADLRKKLFWYRESAMAHIFLFHDLHTLIASNGIEAFQAIVNGRIDKHKAEEAAKLEAIKTQAEADARAKLEAEQLAKEKLAASTALPGNEAAQNEPAPQKVNATAQYMRDNTPPSPTATVTPITKPSRPSDNELIEFVAQNFNVSFGKACDWVIETAERMKQAA